MSIFSRASAVTAFVMATAATPALAATVYNTSLQNLNGAAGTSTYTTTTNASGTTTTVVGPGPNADANRAHGMPVLNSWYQDNVGAGTTVGITTNYARNGNGSAYFNQTQAQTGKADLQYYFGSNGAVSPIALSSLTSYSYDYLRDASSTATNYLTPVLRLNILKDGVFAGTLIWEAAYNLGTGPSATNTWLTGSGDLNTGLFWTNNALLGPTNATAGGTKTLAQWIADNAGSQLSVYGIQVGFGSGWDGTFTGAVDNVNVAFGQTAYSSNFEVATAAVPEPATWAMMMLGFGAMGAALRSRRRAKVVFG
ncbi:PEPxxWA-CTERM sorting domain-containing protein [Sphingomonas sp.]|uniref:PEPxxWA-CTERM sorting domain-containing protein n=1 Tax=Sphingomonas sp. TaxID=28214 RepID=UPI0025D8E7BE|nr:PEPxxWA-CTERM sorting domain-containing protein [Sphingomonas sp.]